MMVRMFQFSFFSLCFFLFLQTSQANTRGLTLVSKSSRKDSVAIEPGITNPRDILRLYDYRKKVNIKEIAEGSRCRIKFREIGPASKPRTLEVFDTKDGSEVVITSLEDADNVKVANVAIDTFKFNLRVFDVVPLGEHYVISGLEDKDYELWIADRSFGGIKRSKNFNHQYISPLVGTTDHIATFKLRTDYLFELSIGKLVATKEGPTLDWTPFASKFYIERLDTSQAINSSEVLLDGKGREKNPTSTERPIRSDSFVEVSDNRLGPRTFVGFTDCVASLPQGDTGEDIKNSKIFVTFHSPYLGVLQVEAKRKDVLDISNAEQNGNCTRAFSATGKVIWNGYLAGYRTYQREWFDGDKKKSNNWSTTNIFGERRPFDLRLLENGEMLFTSNRLDQFKIFRRMEIDKIKETTVQWVEFLFHGLIIKPSDLGFQPIDFKKLSEVTSSENIAVGPSNFLGSAEVAIKDFLSIPNPNYDFGKVRVFSPFTACVLLIGNQIKAKKGSFTRKDGILTVDL